MKIIITEQQARRLKILKEDINPLERVIQYSKLKIDDINKIYREVIKLSIEDVMNPNFNAEIFTDPLDIIYTEIHKLNTAALHYVNSTPDEGDDVILNNAERAINDKIFYIKDILNELKDEAEELKNPKLPF